MRVEALRLDEHACDLGMSRFDPSLNPRDRALNPSGGNRVVEVQLRATSTSRGPKCMVSSSLSRSTPGSVAAIARMLAASRQTSQRASLQFLLRSLR